MRDRFGLLGAGGRFVYVRRYSFNAAQAPWHDAKGVLRRSSSVGVPIA